MGVMVSWRELLDDMDAGTQFPLYWCFFASTNAQILMQKRYLKKKMGVLMSWRQLMDDMDTEAGGTHFTCVTGALLVL
jgi:hypothetical protein